MMNCITNTIRLTGNLTSKRHLNPFLSFVRNRPGPHNKDVNKKITRPPAVVFRYSDAQKYPYEEINPYQPPVPEETIEWEESTEEWKYVEKLFPPLTVPKPGKVSSTDWRPPKDEAPPLSYFVQRTRNHMLPVYVKDKNAGSRRFTLIRGIQGNIWDFEKDLRKYLEEKHQLKMLGSQVLEPMGFVNFRGNYGEDVKQWLYDKGF